METDVLNNMQKILEQLINEFISIYHEAKTLTEISQAKADLTQALLSPPSTEKPLSKNENLMKATQGNDEKSKVIGQSHDKKKNLESYKKTIKKFKGSMASIAKDINHELDIFSVCFAADVESLYLKISQLEEKPKVLKSKVLVSDVIVSEKIEEVEEEMEEDEKVEEIVIGEKSNEVVNIPGDKEKTEVLDLSGEIINFSRISFGGIKKKTKPHKK
ncbi:hypothetical protein SteCoe_27422 [Stentor coeruleus]|uniref:Uncharacterized protein n=1 Tax=Stentor coeruleus TaxID=5963 RepID=A0A1R2BAM1_9CILI|nr:hypothetical protein SteCoe_27422 [Stentor coeruleus]